MVLDSGDIQRRHASVKDNMKHFSLNQTDAQIMKKWREKN